MTERTKGPWWTDTEGRGDQEHNVVCASLGAHGPQVVVDDLNAGYLLDPEERYANAAFIVAAANNHDALVKALRAFVDHATYPVSTEINPRGYAWRGEEALDYAKELADAVLRDVGSPVMTKGD